MTPPPVDETSLLSFTTLLWGVRNFAIARLQKDNGWGLPARVVHSLGADGSLFAYQLVPVWHTDGGTVALTSRVSNARGRKFGEVCGSASLLCATTESRRLKPLDIQPPPLVSCLSVVLRARRPRRMQGAWLAVSNWRLFLYLHPGVCRGEFSQAFICQQDNRD